MLSRNSLPVWLLMPVLLLPACRVSMNQSVFVAENSIRSGSINTINGNIIVGKNAVVKGDCRTINGHIIIYGGASVQQAMSVNGQIVVQNGARIEGNVEAVNGPIRIGRDVDVMGSVTSINGIIELRHSFVEEDIRSYRANISLLAGSRVRGDIMIEKSRAAKRQRRLIKIVLQNGSVVEGDIRINDRAAKVKVYIDADSAVKGSVEGAEVISS